MRRSLSLFAIWIGSTAIGMAGTIISVQGSPGGVSVGTAAAAASWVQTGTYSNVNVSAVMTNASGTGVSVGFHAYLTDAIGPGATVADQIAATTFTLTPGFAQNISLFDLASLNSGTYFLVIAPDIGTNGTAGWAVLTSAPTVILDAGVTHGADRSASTAAGFPPASSFTTINGGSLLYSVTSADQAVPEPATTALFGAGLGLMLVWRARQRRQ